MKMIWNASPAQNKVFLTICISGLILTSAGNIHTTIRETPTVLENIQSVPDRRWRMFYYVTFSVTALFYLTFVAWLVLGMHAQIENATTAQEEEQMEPHQLVNTMTLLLVGMSTVLIPCVIGLTVWIALFSKRGREHTGLSVGSRIATFLALIPNFVLLCMLALLPTGYTDVLAV